MPHRPDDIETPLTGGNVTSGLVRVGDTVRRPAGPQTPAVHALLTHLHDVGYRHAPRSLGLDEAGRHVVEHVPGAMAHPTGPDVPPLDPLVVGRMVRELHDALDGWRPPSGAVWVNPIPADGTDLVIHNDLAPWNIVIGADRLVPIDWEGAGRSRLADTLALRTRSMHTLLRRGHESGAQPWSRLWDEGHGEVWRRDAEWIEAHTAGLRAALLP